MKKILISGGFAPSLVLFRGPLIQAFIDSGVEVVTCAGEVAEDSLKAIEKAGFRFYALPVNRAGLNPVKDIIYYRKLRKLIKKEKPDAVLGYTHKAANYTALAARHEGVAHIYMMVTGLGFAFIDGKGGLLRGLVRLYIENLYRYNSKFCTKVFFQNEDDSKMFMQKKIIRESAVCNINGSGVDMAQYPKMPPPPQGKIVFVLVSRIIADKGIREYVEALRLLRERGVEYAACLVGPMDLNPAGIAMEEVLGWEKEGVLSYLGERKDIHQIIADSHVYVLPSYREGTSRTILEAMATGRPIITTDVPGCRHTVEVVPGKKPQAFVVEGTNGYLVPVRDSKALADAMLRFIENPSLVAEMGAASYAIAKAKFDVKRVNAVILNAILGEKTLSS